MINLKKSNLITIKYLFIIFIYIFFSNKIFSLENKIIFKINENAYTTYDLELRIKYLDFVGSNNNLSKKIILDDLISALLFFEFYQKLNSKENYEDEVNKIFKDILKINSENNKKYKYDIDKDNILFNLKIDLIRKNILEDILNNKINQSDISNQEIDLLYKFNIKYLNFEKEDFIKIENKFKNLEQINYDNMLNLLQENKIEYFLKEKEINNLNKINKKIRENFLENKKYQIIEKDNKLSIMFFEKQFETYEGIILDLYSIRTRNEINNEFLRCENLINKEGMVKKEYELNKLNNEIKNKLVSVNDYVKLTDNSEFLYVVLCNIKFNQEILKKINLNKFIDLNVSITEKNFIEKYSKIYNLIEIYE